MITRSREIEIEHELAEIEREIEKMQRELIEHELARIERDIETIQHELIARRLCQKIAAILPLRVPPLPLSSKD